MNLKRAIPFVLVLAILVPSMAFAQEDTQVPPLDVEFEFTAAEVVVIILGTLGGLTTAYLGWRKEKRKDPNLTFKFDDFIDRVIIAVIASVGLAIASATNIVTLNLFTMFLVYVASIGTAELGLQLAAVKGLAKK